MAAPECIVAARAALDTYTGSTGHDQEEDQRTNILDLITDLLLHAEQIGEDPDSILDSVNLHLSAERTT